MGYQNVQQGLFGDVRFHIPIKSFMPKEDGENYTAVRKALKSLRDKSYEYYEYDENYPRDKRKARWVVISFISIVRDTYKGSGVVELVMQKEAMEIVFNLALVLLKKA